LRRIGNAAHQQSLMADFQPLEGSRIGELTARFDVVLGLTPEDT
jgi:hypothetical protein